MEGAFVFLTVGAVGEAVAYGHVGLTVEDGLTHLACLGLVVGIIAVDHKVAVGFDVSEHLTADIPLALAWLKTDDSAVFERDGRSLVLGIVVIYVKRCTGKLALEIVNNLANSQGLVIAGDYYCNVFVGQGFVGQ